MIFEVRRASFYNDDKPCDEAYKDGDYWVIQLNVYNLIAFCRKYKRVIIDMNSIIKKYSGEVTIYDDYVE